jgi:hypothetical protein
MTKPQISTRRHFLSSASIFVAALAGRRTAMGGNSYPATVLAKHPVAYWRLGEKHGPEAADASGHDHHGTYHGEVLFGETGAIQGDPDTAIAVAPPAAYVEIASSSQFSQAHSGKGLTVEVWMRPDVLTFPGETADAYVMWLGKGEKDEMEWGFRFYSKESTRPNRISAYIWNADGGLGAGAYFQDELKAHEWLHVVGVFDPGSADNPGAGVSIYKNGQLRGSPATSRGALYSSYNVRPRMGTAPVRLGTRDLRSFLTGGLDEAAIYPRKLTAAEVQENYRRSKQ